MFKLRYVGGPLDGGVYDVAAIPKTVKMESRHLSRVLVGPHGPTAILPARVHTWFVHQVHDSEGVALYAGVQ